MTEAELVPVHIDYRDGHYAMTRTDRHGCETWPTHAKVPLRLWQAYQDFCLAAHVWHRIVGALDNDAYAEREP